MLRLPCLVHRLRQRIAFSNRFPDHLAATFDIVCCISAHARLVALPLGWTNIGFFDCAGLLESRGSTGTGFVADFRGDVMRGCGKCLRWSPAASSARSPGFAGDVECFLASEASARAAISRRCAERDCGLLRAFSLANSSGCGVAMCARRPAAW